MRRYRAGILGATGLVGQRLVQRLVDHPWFELTALAASDRSAGRPYDEATRWSLGGSVPAAVAGVPVRRCEPDALADCDVVLSALDATTAREVEVRFAGAGFAVISNSSAHRQRSDVPLVVPEVNASHLDLIERQPGGGKHGFIVTNPNCSTTGLVLATAPLDRAFGLRRVVVATLQAVSGAGLDGPRALDLVDNVIPFIAGEEEKVEEELPKILGRLGTQGIERRALAVSAHCHRVAVLDGHLEAVSLEFERTPEPEAAARVLAEFVGDTAGLDLPSAPLRPIVVRTEPDRPQPRVDRDHGAGMVAVVGRIRRCPVLGLKLELLSHNAVRGAAGGALLNAEMLAVGGRLPRRSGA